MVLASSIPFFGCRMMNKNCASEGALIEFGRAKLPDQID